MGAAVPSPDRAADLCGRDVELALLSTALDRATTGTGGARIVRGDAGIGKSRLLEAVIEQARARSMTVLLTRGVQSEAHLPFAGLHQLLAALLPRLDELGAVQQRHMLVAFGLEDAESADPFRIALAALELLTNAASDGPLLLVADDAQLLDAPTIDVLTFVARRLVADPRTSPGSWRSASARSPRSSRIAPRRPPGRRCPPGTRWRRRTMRSRRTPSATWPSALAHRRSRWTRRTRSRSRSPGPSPTSSAQR